VIPGKAGRLLRTLRTIQPQQLAAQLRHVLSPGVDPRRLSAGEVRFAVETPHAPFLPAPEHARFDGWKGFELIGRPVRFREVIDWEIQTEGPLWSYHLHQFDYLRDPSLTADSRWALVRDWITRHPEGIGWSPHPTSLRILSLGKLALTPGALSLDSTGADLLRGSLASQAETLAGSLEYRLRANHLLSNLIGVVFAGVLFEGKKADAWLGHESQLRRELDEQILPDGAHIERSPMYHGLLLENLLDLLNISLAAPRRAPPALVAALQDCCARMSGAHQVWTHPDGEIALLGDSAFAIAHAPGRLSSYAASLGVGARGPEPSGVLASAGVFRLESHGLTAIVTASPPMPSYQPGHVHCDALSFELSVGGRRVVTDTGVSEYIPGPLREVSRQTRSHATVEVDGREQSEIWAAHRVGGRARVEADCREPGRDVEATCVGWDRRGTLHRRRFRGHEAGLEILDRLEGSVCPARFTLPLAPGLQPRLRPADGRATDARASQGPAAAEQAARRPAMELWLKLESGLQLRVLLPERVTWRLDRAPYYPKFGARVERSRLVGEASEFLEGRWLFEVIGAAGEKGQ
jgi:uncharacterized heparinase superfamily protein